MSDEQKPWERREGEPHRWFQRFEAYRLMGPGRSLAGCANQERVGKGRKESGDAPGSWRNAAREWNWKARAEAWDKYSTDQAAAEAEARWAAMIMGKTEVLARLSEQGRLNLSEFIEQNPKEIVTNKETGESIWIDSASLKWDEIRKRGHLIKKISFNQYGPVIEGYDAQRADQLMGQHYALFVEKVEQANYNVDVSADELAKARDEARAFEKGLLGDETGGEA